MPFRPHCPKCGSTNLTLERERSHMGDYIGHTAFVKCYRCGGMVFGEENIKAVFEKQQKEWEDQNKTVPARASVRVPPLRTQTVSPPLPRRPLPPARSVSVPVIKKPAPPKPIPPKQNPVAVVETVASEPEQIPLVVARETVAPEEIPVLRVPPEEIPNPRVTPGSQIPVEPQATTYSFFNEFAEHDSLFVEEPVIEEPVIEAPPVEMTDEEFLAGRKGIVVRCAYCGARLYRKPSDIKRGRTTFFCSKNHQSLYSLAQQKQDLPTEEVEPNAVEPDAVEPGVVESQHDSPVAPVLMIELVPDPEPANAEPTNTEPEPTPKKERIPAVFVTVMCSNCGKELRRREKEVQESRTHHFYCNRDCAAEHRKELCPGRPRGTPLMATAPSFILANLTVVFMNHEGKEKRVVGTYYADQAYFVPHVLLPDQDFEAVQKMATVFYHRYVLTEARKLTGKRLSVQKGHAPT